MKQCIICDREIPSGIGPRCPRCRQYLHRVGVERPVNLLCARDRATMTGATFRQWRQSWGWSLRQIAEAQHYTYQAVISWEKGRCAVPEAIAAWVRAIGNPPNTRFPRRCAPGCELGHRRIGNNGGHRARCPVTGHRVEKLVTWPRPARTSVSSAPAPRA
jgi:DNA-binding transcriptional regulator YiaG